MYLASFPDLSTVQLLVANPLHFVSCGLSKAKLCRKPKDLVTLQILSCAHSSKCIAKLKVMEKNLRYLPTIHGLHFRNPLWGCGTSLVCGVYCCLICTATKSFFTQTVDILHFALMLTCRFSWRRKKFSTLCYQF